MTKKPERSGGRGPGVVSPGRFRRTAAFAAVLSALTAGGPIAFAQGLTDRAGAVRVELSEDDLFALPVDAHLAADIDAATGKLGSPLFTEREAASKRLVDIGASALAKLRARYRQTHDIEVRIRIEDIIQDAYYNYQVFDSNGFLGVQMRPYPGPQTPQGTLPEGVSGVFVSQIIADTGAKRAGMKKGDIIVGVDAEPLTGNGNSVLNELSAAIRSHRPGSSIALTIVRDAQELTMTVILGRCPERQARTGAVRGTSDLYRQAQTRFPSWWAKNFSASHDEPTSPSR